MLGIKLKVFGWRFSLSAFFIHHCFELFSLIEKKPEVDYDHNLLLVFFYQRKQFKTMVNKEGRKTKTTTRTFNFKFEFKMTALDPGMNFVHIISSHKVTIY